VSRTRPATPSNYLWQSVACLLLCLPCGLVAIVYAAQVNRRIQVGDMTGAGRASRLARTWCLVAVVVFTLAVLWTVATGTLP
jgi:Interferon-induced transmembrane protein